MSVRLGKQGRLVIPAELRRAIGIEGEDELVVWVDDGCLKLQRRDAYEEDLWREFRDDSWTVDDFVAERRADAARELARDDDGADAS